MSTPDPTLEAVYHKRRQRVFLVLSGIFLGTLALLNVLGISRFLDMSFEVFGVTIPVVVAVGVLPYPVTFICTDLI
ncbi:MAG: VUT family protein, partial [Pseudomonadota bacterium]